MPKLNPGEAVVRMDVSTNLNSKFDVIQNCKLAPRRSDVGVLQDEMMLTRRDAAAFYGTMPGSNVDVEGYNGITFFTGTDGNRTAYKAYAGKVYKLVSGNWTDLGISIGSSDVAFQTITLPWGNKSATRTSSATATGIEKIKVDVSNDTTPVNNVGKYVFIVGNATPTATQYNTTDLYRSKYAYVSGYDSANAEYLLEGLGNQTAVQSGTKYVIFDRLNQYLMAYGQNSASLDDKYYDGTAFETDFGLRIDQHFQRLVGTTATKDAFTYDGYVWTHDGKRLFRSEPKNYFFFPITGAIDHSNIDKITEAFVWKDKLIVGGPSSVTVYKRLELEGQVAYQPNVISATYGMVRGSVNNFEKDVYFLTSTMELISLAENQQGIVLPTNVGKPVQNYIKNYLYRVTSGFDGRKFYLYGTPNLDNAAGTAVVYDTVGKFWSTYTGIKFSKIIHEDGKTYFTLHEDFRACSFSTTAEFDFGDVQINQVISTVPITAGDAFVLKEHTATGFYVENTSATFQIYHHYATNGRNGTLRYKGDDTRRYDGVKLVATTNTDYVTGVSMPIPILLKKKGTGNPANMWKITLVADGSNTVGPSGTALGNAVGPIELNELYFTYKISNTDYNRTDFSF